MLSTLRKFVFSQSIRQLTKDSWLKYRRKPSSTDNRLSQQAFALFCEGSTNYSPMRRMRQFQNKSSNYVFERRFSTDVETATPIEMICPQETEEVRPSITSTLSSFDKILPVSRLPISTDCQPCIAIQRKLYTPGPLLVSHRVKQAMLRGIELRHVDFPYLVESVRTSLLQIARVDSRDYTAILVNGSGTAAAEGTLRTTLGNNRKKLIVMDNGRYGKFAKRIVEICMSCGINVKTIPVNLKTLQDTLIASPDEYCGVVVVHCETSSGIVNPVDEIGEAVKKFSPECLYFVDAATSFGAIPFKMNTVDFMIGNSCKSLQGVPGVAFVIAKKSSLDKHRSSSNLGLVLDIGAQYDELERTGMFRHTPPSLIMLAFKECLLEFSDEGGLKGRMARYKKNAEVLKEEMLKMRFEQLHSDCENPNGYLVTSFKYPDIPQFIYSEFCARLDDAGYVICTDRQTISENDSERFFRIGSMGDIYEDDMRALTNSIRQVCCDMNIDLPLLSHEY